MPGLRTRGDPAPTPITRPPPPIYAPGCPAYPHPPPKELRTSPLQPFLPHPLPSAGIRLPIEARGEGAGSRPPDLPSAAAPAASALRGAGAWTRREFFGLAAAGGGWERAREARSGQRGRRPREGPPRTAARGGGEPAGRGRPGCLEGLGREDNSGREGGTCRARAGASAPLRPLVPFALFSFPPRPEVR